MVREHLIYYYITGINYPRQRQHFTIFSLLEVDSFSNLYKVPSLKRFLIAKPVVKACFKACLMYVFFNDFGTLMDFETIFALSGSVYPPAVVLMSLS